MHCFDPAAIGENRIGIGTRDLTVGTTTVGTRDLTGNIQLFSMEFANAMNICMLSGCPVYKFNIFNDECVNIYKLMCATA